MFEESNKFAELWALLHSVSATFSNEVVYSEQKLMKMSCFKRTNLTKDLHEVGYSNPNHMLIYSFRRTA